LVADSLDGPAVSLLLSPRNPGPNSSQWGAGFPAPIPA